MVVPPETEHIIYLIENQLLLFIIGSILGQS